MKYIDAEKLIKRLEEMKRAEYENCGGVNSKTSALQEVQELIASLQQEQPEVDLKNEIITQWSKCNPTDEGMGLESANIVNEQFDTIAKHFYELGKNARKEDDK